MSNEISNYGELKDSVQQWLNRRDQPTVDKIPLFINFAEKEFTRLIRLPYYESYTRAVIENGKKFIDLPPDFLSMKNFVVNDLVCTRVDNETFFRIADRKRETRHFAPYYFTRIGTRILTYPELKDGDLVTMVYNRDIPEMKNDDDSPYSLIIAPDLLLYLALQHASKWLRDNDEVQFWSDKAQTAATALMTQLDEAEWNGSTLQVTTFTEE